MRSFSASFFLCSGVALLSLSGCRAGQPDSANDLDGVPGVVCRPEGALTLPEPGRRVSCAIDVGSRNVKLIVASANNDPLSFRNERQCRARMQLADRTTDKTSGAPKPLTDRDQDALAAVIGNYVKRCEKDEGKLVAAIATEWARRIPNADEVERTIERKTAVNLQILGRQEEARLGYLAATRGERGKLVLDFGSRSLQLAFWSKSSSSPVVLGIPLGIDAAGDRFFGGPAVSGYTAGYNALKQALRAELEPFFAKVRDARGRADIGGQLFSLGENGDLALLLRGQLWQGSNPRAVSESAYASAVRGFTPMSDPARGLVAGVFTPQELANPIRVFETSPALFEDMRSPRLRRVYGNKMLVYPALIALLEAELDLDEVVLVPQEMADGVLLERLGPSTAALSPR